MNIPNPEELSAMVGYASENLPRGWEIRIHLHDDGIELSLVGRVIFEHILYVKDRDETVAWVNYARRVSGMADVGSPAEVTL